MSLSRSASAVCAWAQTGTISIMLVDLRSCFIHHHQ
jgi:hypothetical protein